MVRIFSVLVHVELDPVHLATELLTRRIVVRDWGAKLVANVTGLVSGKDKRLRLFDSALPGLLAINIERDRTAFGNTSAVVLELHPHLMFPRRHPGCAFHRVTRQTEEVVTVFRLAVLCVKRPAANQTALRDDDALGTRLRN